MTAAAASPPRKDPLGGTSRPRAQAGTPGPGSKRPQEPNPPRDAARACVRCGVALVVGVALQPARRYCAVPCRRDAEYEVRRVRRRLRRVEDRRDRWIDADRSSNGFWSATPFFDGTTLHDLLAALQREVLALRRRLHQLRPSHHPGAASCGRKSSSHESHR